jgi:hypothetical protein
MAARHALTDQDFVIAAGKLRCEAAAINAVADVESRGSGFYADGFPTILFERHKFYKHADRSQRDIWARQHPEICNRNATPRGQYGSKDHQRVKFNLAFSLDPEAAMMACSWGAFQELGENYDDYDFASVGEFVDLMKSGIDGQLDIFVRSIKHRGLADELQRHDWRGFARNYNGSEYRRFAYDTQMADRYAVHRYHDYGTAVYVAAAGDGSSELSADLLFEQQAGMISTGVTESALSQTDLPQQPAPKPVEIPSAAAGEGAGPVTGADPATASAALTTSETVPIPGGGTQTTATSFTEPAGDAPTAEPSGWIHVEDWKPWVIRLVKRAWKLFAGANAGQGATNLIGAVRDVEHWYIYVAIAVAIFLFTGFVATLATVVGIVIWFRNRGEISAAKITAARSLVDPNSKNLGVMVEKK